MANLLRQMVVEMPMKKDANGDPIFKPAAENSWPEVERIPDTRFDGKTFRSFQAIAKILNPGEKVWVKVYEHISDGKLKFFAGYGQVEKISETSFSAPKRLDPEY